MEDIVVFQVAQSKVGQRRTIIEHFVTFCSLRECDEVVPGFRIEAGSGNYCPELRCQSLARPASCSFSEGFLTL